MTITTNRRTLLLGLGALTIGPAALADPQTPQIQLVRAARAQIGITKIYDGAYQSIAYPNGDITRLRGVCTDVIVRAYRDALQIDLQRRVHEDMRARFAAYPALWGLTRPDRNIDHRRVPNLEAFLTHGGAKRALPADVSSLETGDLVTMRLPGNLPHIALISDKREASGPPYILHNIGRGTREDLLDSTLQSTLFARFRYLPAAASLPATG